MVLLGLVCCMVLMRESGGFVVMAGRRAFGSRMSRPRLRSRASRVRAWAYELYFDGGSRGNPGPGGCGAVLLKEGLAVWEGWSYLPEATTTNNQAEYVALFLGAKELKSRGVDGCVIKGDSKLVISQMKGEWRVRDKKLAVLKDRCAAELKGIDHTFEHVRRELNTVADALSNRAMDSKASGSRDLTTQEELRTPPPQQEDEGDLLAKLREEEESQSELELYPPDLASSSRT